MDYQETPSTWYLTTDNQVHFYRQLFADTVEPQGCISCCALSTLYNKVASMR